MRLLYIAWLGLELTTFHIICIFSQNHSEDGIEILCKYDFLVFFVENMHIWKKLCSFNMTEQVDFHDKTYLKR